MKNNRFKELDDKYIIPDNFKFLVKAMCDLEEQFDNTESKNVKTKNDILNMIVNIQKSLPDFRYKNNGYNKNKMYDVLIYGEKNKLIQLFHFLNSILNMLHVKLHSYNNTNCSEIHTDFMNIIFLYDKNEHSCRGKRIDAYVNLTNDYEFENTVLKPMLKPKD